MPLQYFGPVNNRQVTPRVRNEVEGISLSKYATRFSSFLDSFQVRKMFLGVRLAGDFARGITGPITPSDPERNHVAMKKTFILLVYQSRFSRVHIRLPKTMFPIFENNQRVELVTRMLCTTPASLCAY